MTATRQSAGGRRAVRLVATARLLSVGGSQAAQIALAFTIYEQTKSAAWVSASLVASAGVVGLLGPVSGWIGDRYDRRRVMVIAEVAAGAGWVATLFVDRPLSLVLLVLAATAANAPFRAASSAAIPNLVDAEDLSWANGVIATAFNASLVVGPLVGGAVVAAGGSRWVFAINSATFMLSAVVLAVVPGEFSEPGMDAPGVRPGGMRAGFTLVARDATLRALVGTTSLSFAAFGVTLVADLPLTDHFDAGSVGYGLLTTLWGTGAVVGSSVAARWMPPDREPRALVLGTAAMGLSIGSISVMPNFPLAVLVGTIGGLGSGYALTPWFSLVQRSTADHVRGRVFAAAETCEQLGFVGGMLVAGTLVDRLGPRPTYLVPGGLLFAAAFVATRYRR